MLSYHSSKMYGLACSEGGSDEDEFFEGDEAVDHRSRTRFQETKITARSE